MRAMEWALEQSFKDYAHRDFRHIFIVFFLLFVLCFKFLPHATRLKKSVLRLLAGAIAIGK